MLPESLYTSKFHNIDSDLTTQIAQSQRTGMQKVRPKPRDKRKCQ